MKSKKESNKKTMDTKQDLVDIYLLTFYKKPSIQQNQVENNAKRRRLSVKRKAESVKEMNNNENPQQKNILPLNQNQFQRVLSQDYKYNCLAQPLATERLQIPQQSHRYKSVNLTKKFQYLHNPQQNIEQSITYSKRLTFDKKKPKFFSEDKWPLQKINQNQNYFSQLEQLTTQDILPIKIEKSFFQSKQKSIFPKEFSSNGLYKKYFA